jgi:aminopeptidase N
VPAPAADHEPTFTPGRPGIGDEYFPLAGNGGYDVTHYGLAVRYQPRTDLLVGRAAIHASATQNLSRFNLDFEGLTVRSVRVDGRRATWRHDGGELIITPSRGLRAGHHFTTVVRYDGVPRTLPDGSGFIHTDDGILVIGEPQVAATWFPVNDHPSDKASYTFRVTAPRGLEAVANGILTKRHAHGAWRTWTWQAREPMASYLATANIGQFDLHFYRHRGIWMLDAIDPDLFEREGTAPPPGVVARRSFARHGEILDFLASRFGPYPFNAAGGIVDDAEGLGFALENQTRPIYARDFFTDRLQADFVVVHELAHQWYGDSLAVRRWRDIWLNEGFASYAEWLWSEHEGLGTAQELFDAYYGGIPADDPFWRLRIGDPGPDSLFDGAVYIRGAMTLHSLRLRVGDADFFTILRRWARVHEGGNVSTPQFVRLAERVSGEQLDDLFDTWLYTSTKPAGASGSASRAAAPLATAERLLERARR